MIPAVKPVIRFSKVVGIKPEVIAGLRSDANSIEGSQIVGADGKNLLSKVESALPKTFVVALMASPPSDTHEC